MGAEKAEEAAEKKKNNFCRHRKKDGKLGKATCATCRKLVKGSYASEEAAAALQEVAEGQL